MIQQLASLLEKIDLIKQAFSEIEDIDPEILSYLIQINRYKGVMTLVSCAGHTFEDIEKTQRKSPGKTLYPYVELQFDSSRVFASFCKEAAQLGGGTHISLFIHPNVRVVMIEPSSDTGQITLSGYEAIRVISANALPEVRDRLFQQIIEILDDITTEEKPGKLRLKASAIKILNECGKG